VVSIWPTKEPYGAASAGFGYVVVVKTSGSFSE
jgi:hypothetical protein